VLCSKTNLPSNRAELLCCKRTMLCIRRTLPGSRTDYFDANGWR
jgi:hypothetical protein